MVYTLSYLWEKYLQCIKKQDGLRDGQKWTDMIEQNTTENLGGGQRDAHHTIFSVFLYV